MRIKYALPAALVGLLTLSSVWSQEEAEKNRQKKVEMVMSATAVSEGDTYKFISSQASFDLTPVKGAPYSAEAVTTTTRALSDGNRIFRESVTRVYRDSEGRTRRELDLPVIGAWTPEEGAGKKVFIHDPVEGVSYTLNPDKKTAFKTSIGVFSLHSSEGGERGSGSGVKTWVDKEGNKSTFIIRRSGDGKLKVESGEMEELEVEGDAVVVMRKDGEAKLRARAEKLASAHAGGKGRFRVLPGEPPHVRFYSGGVGGPQLFHFADEFDEADIQKESLGTRTFEGVVAEGERTVRTIQAGKIGNEMPIQIVSERWYSPDLESVIMSRHEDPRFGETVFELRNIDQSEPSPDLFQVPSDYEIKEAGFGNAFHYRPRKEKN